MADNTDNAALAMLKTDLGYHTISQDLQTFLLGKLDQARARIRRMGLDLDEADTSDLLFLVSVASHMVRKRDAGEGLSRMILDEVHDRQVADTTGGGA